MSSAAAARRGPVSPSSAAARALCCLFLAGSALLGTWLTAAEARAASEALRVRVQRPLEDDALIDEAVNRAIGELGAIGFDVEVLRRRTRPSELNQPGQLEAGTEGALVFARDGNVVLVSVWVAEGSQAFVQRFDTTTTGPDVIAVNAVEALRGVLIAPGSRPAQTEPEEAPRSAETASPKVTPIIDEPDPLPGDDAPDAAEDGSRKSALWAMLLGAPTFGFDAGGQGSFGAGGSVVLGYGALALGAGAETTFDFGPVQDPAGSAELSRTTGFGTVRGRLSLSSGFDGFAHLNVGASRYEVLANAEAGFVATNRAHTAMSLGFGVGAAHWTFGRVGFFAGFDGLVLPTPIRVRMDERTVAKLGAPAVQLSLGLAGRVP